MNTEELLDRLQRHYVDPSKTYPGGLFLPEVTWGGMGGPRADALWASFTSTGGRILVGHEIKVSRADWRHELDQPGKADAWHDECHAWYVVAPSTDVVPPAELPAGWGLLVVNPRSKIRLKVAVKADVDRTKVPSWHASRSMLSRADTLWGRDRAVVRRAADLEGQIEERAQRIAASTLGFHDKRRLELLARVEERLGVELDAWESSTSGDSIPRVEPERLARILEVLRSADDAEQIIERLTNRRGAIYMVRRQLDTLDAALRKLKPDAER